MRIVAVLALVCGCQQLFGLDHPVRLDASADVSTDTANPFRDCNPAETGLVACYDFENKTDNQSNAAFVTSNTDVEYVTGQRGFAVRMTAFSSIRIAEHPALDLAAVTMEAWVRPTQMPMSVGSRMSIWDTANQYGIALLPDAIRCTGYDVPVAIAINVWTHIACADNGSQLTIYVNGVATMTLVSSPFNLGPDGAAIGGHPTMDWPFVGDIDLVRVYDHVRSAQEICKDAAVCL